MKIKKLFYIIFILILVICPCFSSEVEKKQNNLRTMFQNNEAVIYALNIRTFNAVDKNGNGIIDFSLSETPGSFVNAVERLDELVEFGINAVHLLPVTPVGRIKALGTAGSLYAMSDFTSLNPQLEDFKSELPLKEQMRFFVDECHKRNIKVIVDLPSCGSYDMFINKPDLFMKHSDGSAVIPADWVDVRLFDISDEIKSLLKSDIFVLHKLFVNYMINIGVDGIRADVATIKPFIFWKELISYARSKKPDFFFLAEASENWTMPACNEAYFTDYKKLLEAGFDGYYGNYFDLKNWKTMEALTDSVLNQQKTINKYREKKSVIGSFATHDVVSPLITGGENFSKIIIWLNSTLPLNPYFVDGFLQADDYIYDYSNKEASVSYTDDIFYYVHQGQIDIFNFSRPPQSDSTVLSDEQKIAIKFRNDFLPQITKGSFVPLVDEDEEIFAFQRIYKNKSVAVIINRNLAVSRDISLKLKNVTSKSKIGFIKTSDNISVTKNKVSGRLKPAEIIVLSVVN